MNITREKLTQLLSEAFDEGMSGYSELKESFVADLVEKYDLEEKKSLLKTPFTTSSTASSMGSFTFTSSHDSPSAVRWEDMPMTITISGDLIN
jgi:hypothetical protein